MDILDELLNSKFLKNRKIKKKFKKLCEEYYEGKINSPDEVIDRMLREHPLSKEIRELKKHVDFLEFYKTETEGRGAHKCINCKKIWVNLDKAYCITCEKTFLGG